MQGWISRDLDMSARPQSNKIVAHAVWNCTWWINLQRATWINPYLNLIYTIAPWVFFFPVFFRIGLFVILRKMFRSCENFCDNIVQPQKEEEEEAEGSGQVRIRVESYVVKNLEVRKPICDMRYIFKDCSTVFSVCLTEKLHNRCCYSLWKPPNCQFWWCKGMSLDPSFQAFPKHKLLPQKIPNSFFIPPKNSYSAGNNTCCWLEFGVQSGGGGRGGRGGGGDFVHQSLLLCSSSSSSSRSITTHKRTWPNYHHHGFHSPKPAEFCIHFPVHGPAHQLLLLLLLLLLPKRESQSLNGVAGSNDSTVATKQTKPNSNSVEKNTKSPSKVA